MIITILEPHVEFNDGASMEEDVIKQINTEDRDGDIFVPRSGETVTVGETTPLPEEDRTEVIERDLKVTNVQALFKKMDLGAIGRGSGEVQFVRIYTEER